MPQSISLGHLQWAARVKVEGWFGSVSCAMAYITVKGEADIEFTRG